jgi:hypothetical protein
MKQVEDAIGDLVEKTPMAARKCSASYCYNLVQGFKRLLAEFGVNVSCSRSKCSWVYQDRKWIRVCTLDCGNLTGTITSD